MAAYNKFNAFTQDVTDKVHNLATDTLKIMLTNVAPVATNAVKADITEIAAGNGYAAGGSAVTIASNTQTSGTDKLLPSAQVTFTCNTANMAAFRYAVLYNSTPVAGNLIGWWDYGSALTLTPGDQFTVGLDLTNGIFTMV